tara:strand:- start:2688 stop:3293 length:606 start_codon:yes stop_codon:yes gene_type:complete
MIEVESRCRNVIFPTYVFELDLKEYDKDFYKEIISDHMVTRTEPLTLSNTDLHKDEKMKEFCDFILEQHKSVMHTLGYVPQDLSFSGMWGVEQNKHGYHRQHFHPNNWMCGVFYIDTHEEDAIVFHDPRLRAGVIQPKTFDYNEYNTSINRFPSPEGKIYMFPNWLEHSVEPLVHDKTRISISWNIKIPEQLGCGYGCTDG